MNTSIHQSACGLLPAETPQLKTLGSIIAEQRRNISGNDMAIRGHYRR
jgi:hypothetical protein